jgi:phenylalanyl-tRNA synthetase beta chain
MVDGLDVPAESLERLITMKTAECEGIETGAGELAGRSVAARVERSSRSKAATTSKRSSTRAATAARPWSAARRTAARHDSPSTFRSVSKDDRRRLSDGMLASAAELGISRDHAGIIELERPAIELPPPDSVIEIDNKSITHRPDLWGHHGMAREVAAITGQDRCAIRSMADLLPPRRSPVKIEIEDLALCPRYSALVFENVTVQPSPLWLQHAADRGRPEPDQQHRRSDELPHGRTRAADARVRSRQTARRHHFARPARAGERIAALNDEEYDARAFESGDRRRFRPDRDRRRDRRTRQRHLRTTTSIVLESANFQAPPASARPRPR